MYGAVKAKPRDGEPLVVTAINHFSKKEGALCHYVDMAGGRGACLEGEIVVFDPAKAMGKARDAAYFVPAHRARYVDKE